MLNTQEEILRRMNSMNYFKRSYHIPEPGIIIDAPVPVVDIKNAEIDLTNNKEKANKMEKDISVGDTDDNKNKEFVSSDEDDLSLLCPKEDHFLELFKKCRSGAFNSGIGNNEVDSGLDDDIFNPQPGRSSKVAVAAVQEEEKDKELDNNTSKKRKKNRKRKTDGRDTSEVTTDECDSPDSDVELLFTEYRNYCKEVDQRARENAFTREAMESSNQEGSRKLRSGRTTFDKNDGTHQPGTSKAPRSGHRARSGSTLAVSNTCDNEAFFGGADEQRGPRRKRTRRQNCMLGNGNSTNNNNSNSDMVVVDISDGDMTPPKKPMFADYKPYHAAATDVSDDDVEIIVPKPNIKYMGVSVRVKFRGTLHRFTHWETDEIIEVKKSLATATGFPANEFIFYKPAPDDLFPMEDWITVEESEIGLDIIDAIRGKSKPTTGKDPRDGNPKFVKVVFQNGQLRAKKVVLYLRKTETLQNVTEKYIEEAELIGIEESEIKFMFDGEPLNLQSTPMALDMEPEECIDVFINNNH